MKPVQSGGQVIRCKPEADAYKVVHVEMVAWDDQNTLFLGKALHQLG
jgi:hypothetical protein